MKVENFEKFIYPKNFSKFSSRYAITSAFMDSKSLRLGRSFS